MTVQPWNRDLLIRLGRDRDALPHALLLHGPAGIGKRDLGLALIQWLLCEHPEVAGACGRCDACNWFEKGNHPDFRALEPGETDDDETGESAKPVEKGKSAKRSLPLIKIEAVRALTDYLQLSAHRGGWRTALIQPSEYMNAAAANALLKTLEEPPPRVLMVLVSHQPGRLPATVRSRCRKIGIGYPLGVVALDWMREQGIEKPESLLAEAGGAPLTALANADPEHARMREIFLDHLANPAALDACALAREYRMSLTESWGWLTRWIHDLIRQRLATLPRYFPNRHAHGARVAATADLAGLLDFQRELTQAGRWLRHPLNGQLLLESWLIRYAEIAGKP